MDSVYGELHQAPAEMRLRGTEAQLMQLMDWLINEMGDHILEISPKHKDRKMKCSSKPNTYRDI